MVDHDCAVITRCQSVSESETGVIGCGVVVHRPTVESSLPQRRLTFECGRGIQGEVTARSSSGHQVVDEQPGAELDPADSRAVIDGPGECKRLYQVGRDAKQNLPLPDRFVDAVQLGVLEVPDPAMHQPRRPSGGSARKVIALD